MRAKNNNYLVSVTIISTNSTNSKKPKYKQSKEK